MARFASSGPTPKTQPVSPMPISNIHAISFWLTAVRCNLLSLCAARSLLPVGWPLIGSKRWQPRAVPKLPLPSFMSRHGSELASQCASPARCRLSLTSRPFLQRIGPACVAAYNSIICAWIARGRVFGDGCAHCSGSEMAELMAYGASVGAAKARAKANAVGFIGCAGLNSAFLWSRKGPALCPTP